ncbi:MAG: SH3 domain-containing protein [Caulobacterales bacterium]|jgi:SH3-like domain-containing protein
MDGQGEAQQLVRLGRGLLKTAALGLLTACSVSAGGHAGEKAAGRQTPSGMPVPRYVSLKFDKVNARAGPGDDYRLLFVYRVRGLPLQVVAETSEWRRVCDPQGALAWVHKRTTDGRRMTMNAMAAPVALLKRPRDGAQTAAYLNARALAALDRCEKGWCKVRVDHASGWVRQGMLWGAADAPQCRQGGS